MTTSNAALATKAASANETDAVSRLETMAHLPKLQFSPSERNTIRDTCFNGASPAEMPSLIALAEARGLNPLTGDCYFVEQWDAAKGRKVWSLRASIDSFRSKAEETGLYAGQDEPEYEYDAKGALVLARVRVYRKDWPRPSVGVARFAEYVQTTKDGCATSMWRKMGHNQLAKCAEMLALRKAFPRALARVYGKEEMEQAENVAELRPDPEPGPVRVTEDGEVVDTAATHGRPSNAAAPSSASSEALFAQRKAELTACAKHTTREALARVEKAITSDAKRGLLTLEQTAMLRDVTKQMRLVVAANAEAAKRREAEEMGDVGDFDASFDGPVRDWASEAAMFKQDFNGALDMAARDAVRSRFAAWSKDAPREIVDEVDRFVAMIGERA